MIEENDYNMVDIVRKTPVFSMRIQTGNRKG